MGSRSPVCPRTRTKQLLFYISQRTDHLAMAVRLNWLIEATNYSPEIQLPAIMTISMRAKVTSTLSTTIALLYLERSGIRLHRKHSIGISPKCSGKFM